jgi:hypothetical protein
MWRARQDINQDRSMVSLRKLTPPLLWHSSKFLSYLWLGLPHYVTPLISNEIDGRGFAVNRVAVKHIKLKLIIF